MTVHFCPSSPCPLCNPNSLEQPSIYKPVHTVTLSTTPMGEEVKEGPFTVSKERGLWWIEYQTYGIVYGDKGIENEVTARQLADWLNARFSQTEKDRAFWKKRYDSRDAEVLGLKQHAELDASVINQFKLEVAELRDKLKKLKSTRNGLDEL